MRSIKVDLDQNHPFEQRFRHGLVFRTDRWWRWIALPISDSFILFLNLLHRDTRRQHKDARSNSLCISFYSVHLCVISFDHFSFILAILLGTSTTYLSAQQNDSTTYLVKKTSDFQVNGVGDNAGWTRTDWVPITVQESANRPLTTKTKALYSPTGMYFLFQCDDEKLTATIQEDFGTLFKEDVVEVFLWPDPAVPIYFEYEVSPLNYELPILVPNLNGRAQGWKPWNYRGSNKTQHATSVQEGERKSNATVKGWTAEFFIPYRLMNPIVPTIPASGTKWRGNLYRIDYDQGYQTWSWKKTSGNFHEFKQYGTLVFE